MQNSIKSERLSPPSLFRPDLHTCIPQWVTNGLAPLHRYRHHQEDAETQEGVLKCRREIRIQIYVFALEAL